MKPTPPSVPPWLDAIRKCLDSLPGLCLALDADLQVLAATDAAKRRWGHVSRDLAGPLAGLVPKMGKHAQIHQKDGLRREVVLELAGNPREAMKVSSRWMDLEESGFHMVVFEAVASNELEPDWFRLAVEAAPEGMLLVDSRGRIVFANREIERVFGHTVAELSGKKLEILLPERFRHRHEGHRSGFLADPSARMMGLGRNLFGLHKNGLEIPIEIGLNPLHRNGEWFVFASIVDISQRQKMEAKLIQTQKLEGLGVLAGGIAHDFNNILAAIQGYAELIRAKHPSEPGIDGFVEHILVGTRRGAELIGQMLNYAGKSKYQLERIDLHSLIAEMVKLMEVSISKSAVLDLQLDSRIPPILGDASQIRQIVLNLIVNASDSFGNDPGLISIRLGCVGDGQAEADILPGFQLDRARYVYIEVKDNGCGITEVVRSSMFDPFFTTKTAGRGLGLSSVVGILKSHNGGIGIDSVPGEGTKIRVYFPALTASELASALPKVQTAHPGVGARRVLVVDDEPEVRTAAAEMLTLQGHRVTLAEDGLDAMDVFSRPGEKIELILLDMTMPRMNGIQALKYFKANSPNVKIILSSGYGEPDDLDFSPSTGLAAFLRKPYSYAQLRDAVAKAFAPPPSGASD